MRARVYVTLRPVVNDPQGLVVRDALHTLGYPAVEGVRVGKYSKGMLQLDLDYIERWSLWRDLGILLRTVGAVLRGRGAY